MACRASDAAVGSTFTFTVQVELRDRPDRRVGAGGTQSEVPQPSSGRTGCWFDDPVIWGALRDRRGRKSIPTRWAPLHILPHRLPAMCSSRASGRRRRSEGIARRAPSGRLQPLNRHDTPAIGGIRWEKGERHPRRTARCGRLSVDGTKFVDCSGRDMPSAFSPYILPVNRLPQRISP
jgi:hypothetical protein